MGNQLANLAWVDFDLGSSLFCTILLRQKLGNLVECILNLGQPNKRPQTDASPCTEHQLPVAHNYCQILCSHPVRLVHGENRTCHGGQRRLPEHHLLQESEEHLVFSSVTDDLCHCTEV